VRLEEREAQSQHARLLLPAVDEGAAFGLVEREAAEDGEAVGIAARRIERDLARLLVPARRMNDHAVDAGRVHFLEQLLGGEARHLAMGAVGLAAAPEMDLGIDYFHGASHWPKPIRRFGTC
jgi:hypothetical protein